MGYTRDGKLPAGVTFFGRAWDEMTLISLAYPTSSTRSIATRHPRGSPLSAK